MKKLMSIERNPQTSAKAPHSGQRQSFQTTKNASAVVVTIALYAFASGPDAAIGRAEKASGVSLRVLIAGAGGAAHLPGMLAAKTLVPVLGVPIPATMLQGIDSLLSIVQMPKGVPVGTLAIGRPGAANAALLAVEILATTDPDLRERLRIWRDARTKEVLAQGLPE